MPAKKVLSQSEMVSKNLVIDLGEHYSISSFKGFEPWNFDFRDYNPRIPCKSGLFPSKKK
ncbi:hypothetical protein J1N35_022495, partial [Gossypium stocksii]